MRLLLATSNPGKIIEIREALAGLPLTLLSPQDVSITDVPKEEGHTYAENAAQKARFYASLSSLPTLADDSGITVHALQNELGIHTRRWGAGPDASDARWISFFLERMRGEADKRATFVCVLCLIDAEGKEHFFEGTCDGIITDELEADYLPGLPISACFKPDGYDWVFSALTIEQKNSASHRGRALEALRNYLENNSL